MAIKLVEEAGGIVIAVKVVPGASRDRIVGELGDALKIAVSKPPQGGAANQAVVALLAEALGLSRASVAIVHGHSNPRKRVLVRDLTIEQLRERIENACQ
jgi:uncharacterized protein (TIGR00251 family)